MKRKIFTLIMVLMMVMTMIPVPAVHSHAHAEDEHVHDWTKIVNYRHQCSCGARCSDDNIATEVDVARSSTTCNTTKNVFGNIVFKAACGTAGHNRQISNVPAIVTTEAATCKSPAKTVYTAEGYPEVVWTVPTGTELADHNWQNEDGVCSECGAVHNHTYDANGECTECDYVAPKCEHPDDKNEYVSDGKGKHTMVCGVCKENILSNFYFSCNDSNPNDGLCDKCGYELYHSHDWSKKDGICAKE
ncbi:MAG: hypothetical protein IJN21_08670, partial [Clostridia bacterium]|nr:hypothetical protein [Clostridia bacterium]